MARRFLVPVELPGDAAAALHAVPRQQLDAHTHSPASPVAVSGTTGAINIDAAPGRHFRVQLGGPRTLAATTNATDGMTIIVEFVQDATGNRVVTLTEGVAQGWSLGGQAASVDLLANRRSYLIAVYNGVSARWHILGSRIGFS